MSNAYLHHFIILQSKVFLHYLWNLLRKYKNIKNNDLFQMFVEVQRKLCAPSQFMN